MVTVGTDQRLCVWKESKEREKGDRIDEGFEVVCRAGEEKSSLAEKTRMEEEAVGNGGCGLRGNEWERRSIALLVTSCVVDTPDTCSVVIFNGGSALVAGVGLELVQIVVDHDISGK